MESKTHLLVQVGISPSVVLESELSRTLSGKIGVEDTERVEVGDVVTSNLVGSDEELDL